jgi:mRNA interferase MazF
MQYKKDYEKWHKLKKILNELEFPLFCREREIWRAILGANIGTEMDGKGDEFTRPVLIIRVFNQDHLLIVPLTHTKNIHKNTHVHVTNDALYGFSSVAINQIQTMSNKRLLEYIGILENKQFLVIVEHIIGSIEVTKRTKPNK